MAQQLSVLDTNCILENYTGIRLQKYDIFLTTFDTRLMHYSPVGLRPKGKCTDCRSESRGPELYRQCGMCMS